MQELRLYLDKITSLNNIEWKSATNLFKEEKISKGEYFVKPNEVCTKIAFIKKGLFRLLYLLDGEEKTTLFFTENQFVTDYFSFLTKAPSIRLIEALEDSVIYTASYSGLHNLFQYRNWESIGRIMAEYAYIYSVLEANRLLHDDLETRFVIFLRESPELIQRVPQYMIASYLKMTPETLSRIKKEFIKIGINPIIQFNSRNFKIEIPLIFLDLNQYIKNELNSN